MVEALHLLRKRISGFERNVFNADECGLFYKIDPDATVAINIPGGLKKNKERITVLVG